MISFKQLRYFDAVARHKHFGRAADHCAVTQPALSMQLQELERELKLQLVERRRNGIQLTEDGREIARRAQRILADLRDLRDYAHQRAGRLTGTLHFGVIPSIAPYILPRFLPLLRDAFPELDVHIRETQTRQLTAELVEGSLDLMLAALPVDHADIETIRLFDDRFLLALPASRELHGRVQATPDLLKDDRLLLLEEGHCLRDQALTFCNLRRIENIDTFGASSLSTLVQMVANGLGLTLLPEICVDVEARYGALKLMRFADPEPHRVLGLAWRSSSPRKRDFVEFGRMIVEARPALPPETGTI
ncbi:hydrogen peroxide-inducible genes activator [Phreatobacter sp. AB_2022a]|uniref:hydrogen peroxide-inducible genes activator n=1 Tax=Phreatobacter sp. AB_2022a TaxID=3003134 RepID=UPI002286D018|nr:hydrogen peroxide-inducible genes activator [Phreatobacter sp. AB_2022a]MCZ0736275.1 LysR substrate-binding domain-containing protein [Phreatobacter sp. AB_2022a]